MLRAYQVILVATALTTLLGCRESDDARSRRLEEFEAVSEGAADGVTSTLAAPGETPAPLLTDTNADTTTSFDILGPAPTTTATDQPGTLADTLPDESQRQRTIRPRPRPTEPLPTTTSEPAPEPPPAEAPEAQPEPAPTEDQPTEDQPTETQPTETQSPSTTPN